LFGGVRLAVLNGLQDAGEVAHRNPVANQRGGEQLVVRSQWVELAASPRGFDIPTSGFYTHPHGPIRLAVPP
jgi:hypothetical protein